MATPVQMTQHTLTALKGWLPSDMSALDYTAKISANVTVDPVYSGKCVHLNDVGEFEMGCPNGTAAAKKITMPLFVFQSSNDPDVSNPGGITGSVNDAPGGWMGISSRGYITGLVATGGYELETTEFDSTDTYVPNNSLKSAGSNSVAATSQLTKGTCYVDPIVGIVSRVPYTNSHRRPALAFWPYVLPPTT